MSGQSHRHDGAEGDQQDDGGGDESDHLGADGCRLRQGRDRAADLDLQGVVACREDGIDQRRGLRRGVLVDGLVEGDVGVRRRAVVARSGRHRPPRTGWRRPRRRRLRATSAKSSSARARTWGDVTPCSEWSTIWTVSPARCGKLSCSVSEAALDSDPGWR